MLYPAPFSRHELKQVRDLEFLLLFHVGWNDCCEVKVRDAQFYNQIQDLGKIGTGRYWI